MERRKLPLPVSSLHKLSFHVLSACCGMKKIRRRIETGHEQKHTTSSLTYGGGNVMLCGCHTSKQGTLVFIDDVSADRGAE